MDPIRPADTSSDDLGTSLWRWVGLLSALTVVSVLHYTTDAEHAWLHNIYQRLYYAPIVMGAYWFGVRGGFLTAVAAAVAYYPHILHTWGHNVPYAASQYVELVIFPCAGVLVGILADWQRKLTRQYRETASSLEAANRELRDSQEQLRRADRLSALGEIAAGLAHEIRNPLAGIKGAIEIVGARVRTGTPEAEFTGVATKELQRLDGLVSEFLAYARPRDPEFRDASLSDVVGQVVTLLSPEAERAAVTVRLTRGCDVTVVRMDPEQMQQVVFNLLLNGIQASPRGSAVDVGVICDAGWVAVTVTDRGPGVAAEDRERLFDPFFTTKTNGTGLGLAVSQRIVSTHRGRIGLEDAPGGGCRAFVLLPVRQASG